MEPIFVVLLPCGALFMAFGFIFIVPLSVAGIIPFFVKYVISFHVNFFTGGTPFLGELEATFSASSHGRPFVFKP